MTPNPRLSGAAVSLPKVESIGRVLLRTAWVWPILILIVVMAASIMVRPPHSTGEPASTLVWLKVQNSQDPLTDQDDEWTGTRAVILEPGREVRLLMKGGKTYRGEFVSQDRLNVIIKIVGITTTFDRLKVTKITPLKTFDEQYHDLTISISRHNYFRRFELCQWLYRRKKYQLAAEELESLLDDTSEYPEARTLLRTVNNAIAVLGPDGSVKPVAPDKGNPMSGASPGSGRYVEASLLSDTQINLLRIYEVNLNDPPRMIVSRKTIDRLFERYADSDLIPQTVSGRRKFYVRAPADILKLMFELQAREFYGEVRVLSEPEAFIRFRMDVQRTWLTNSCATTKCHGGPDAGDFYLFNKRTNHSRTVYTNFLILERSRVNGEPLINYEQPAESLLLQMGLLRNQTTHPHPEVSGWRPVFRSRTDPIFQKAVDWINTMYHPRPDYPVEYELPKIRLSAEAEGFPTGEKEEEKSGSEAGSDLSGDAADDDQGGDGR